MSSPPEWAPERVIDVALARRTIADQFPELAGQPVRSFDAGWDNLVLAVGDEWLFRFIHRSVALTGAARELAVLRLLDDRFSLAIPRPVFVGSPTAEVSWPFWGARALPGRGLAESGMPDDERAGVAAALGAFLRELHSPHLAEQATQAAEAEGLTLPVDPIGRSRPSSLAPRARLRLDDVTRSGGAFPRSAVADVLAAAEVLGAPAGDPVLVHGDLHVRHVLVADGRATGVIDWGDTALADPSVDLMIAFMAFTDSARAAFFGAYGEIDPDQELRARACAVHVAAALAQSAIQQGLKTVATEALDGLRRATV